VGVGAAVYWVVQEDLVAACYEADVAAVVQALEDLEA
jgi:hypothetical protein